MSYQKYLSKIICIDQNQSDCCSKGYRAARIVIAFIASLFFLSFFNLSFAATTCIPTIQNVYVAKGVGKDGIEKPTSNWQKINLPDDWSSRWQDYSGTVWYRIDLAPSCDIQHNAPADSIALLIESLSLSGEIYFNQDLLWRAKHFSEPLSRHSNSPKFFIIPKSTALQPDNHIWIRVIGVAGESPGLGKVNIDTRAKIYNLYTDLVWKKRTLFIINIILSVTLGVITLCIWLLRREEVAFGWFALSSFCWVLFIANVLSTEAFPFPNTYVVVKANLCFFVGYVIAYCLFCWRFTHKIFPRLEKYLFTSTLVTIAIIWLLPNPNAWMGLRFIFLIYVLIFFINSLFMLGVSYQAKQLEVRLLGLVIFLCIFGILYDLSVVLFHVHLPFFPLTSYSSQPIAVFLTLVLAMRLTRSIKRIERFNIELSNKIKQVSTELTTSLQDKYQLELENIKLQERLFLAHELHDGLGGSLVRSIAMIDQSKNNLSNPQFLSILKLLRDDLRQIIDSGSSIGAKVPESPQVWGAPIRYRFVQIFDELGIHSKWDFPESWYIQPTTLECLTLLRVIEESLTNIIKHSQAKNVGVCLFFNAHEQLILEIKDDGVGFDVDTVLKSGISVGIRSMQIRLQKINASMLIRSESGKTYIRVTKLFQQSSSIPD